MQTGYDNFWMYQNNRHEPVHNLPKNDNYSHPVLTNNYKQLQNGIYPSNTYYTPAESARSQNGQYNSDPRCMWPSSVYSMPYSYANNFHSQMFPTQTNNYNYSSQLSQPKPTMRNSNLKELQKNSYKQSNIITRLPQISNYSDTDTARIRVKDVFTLNNNSMYNSVSENNLIQTQKNKQYEYPLNHAQNNCNRTCDFETNESVLKHIPSSYVQRQQPCLNDQQQFLQYSDTPYQQNTQLSPGSQIQSNGKRQLGSNLQPVGFNKKPSLLIQMLRNEKQKEVQNNCSDTLTENTRVTGSVTETNHFSGLKAVNSHISTEKNNNINYRDLSQVNETYSSYTKGFGVQNQNQGNLRNIDQDSSSSQSPSTEGLRILASDTNSLCDSRISNSKNNVVKITIPHTGQSTYIRFNELSDGDKNSTANFLNLLETHKEIYGDPLSKKNTQNHIQNNGPSPFPESGPVKRQSCNTSSGTNQSYNISSLSISNDCNSTTRNSNYTYYNNNMTSGISYSATTPGHRFQQESFNKHSEAFLSSKDCSENTPENSGANISFRNENVAELNENSQVESISREEIVAVKQESLGVYDSSVQPHQNITIDENIKTEKYSEDYEIEQQSQSSENSGLPSEDINSNTKEERAVSKQIDCQSKTECENSGSESDIPRNTLNKETKPEKNDTGQALEKTEEKNYVSKINRDKLDLLIQFLKKEEEGKTKTFEENDPVGSEKKTSDDIKKKKEVDSTRSRRKLNKTDIVKNRNNSREMVSLKSHKTSRTETQDSPKRLQPSKTDENPKKEEKKKIYVDEINKNEKPVDLFEDVKSYSPSQDSKELKNSNSTSEPEIRNVTVSNQTKENPIDEEKNIVSIMQALQNLKSHFCLSCTLVSSIDSFWINVVSGELRCLNCFKKMNMKIDENIFKLRRACSEDFNKTDIKPPPHDKKGNENKKDNFENKAKCECEKSNELTKFNEERGCTSKNKNSEMKDATPRKKSGESEERSSMSKDDFTSKTEDTSKVEMKTKRKLSGKEEISPDKIQNSEEKISLKTRRKSNSEETQVTVNTLSKQWLDSPERRKSISKEEKTKAHYDNLKKEKKPFSQSAEKEQSVRSSRESLEKESRDSEKSVKQFREEDVLEAGKKDKKSTQSRRRTNSKEEVGHHKVRISEEEFVSAIKSPSKDCFDSWKLHSPSETSDRSRGFSKEFCTDQKTKISRHPKTSPVEDSEKRNIFFPKNIEKLTEHLPKKRKKSVEDLIPRKLYIAEDRTKFQKQSFEKSKNSYSLSDAGLKPKTIEHSKHHVPDYCEIPRRKSKDEWLAGKTEMKNLTESDKTRRNSTLKENLNSSQSKNEIKYKRMILDNYEKDKKSFLGKIPKISRKSTEMMDSEPSKSPQNDDNLLRSSLTAKPLKESQRTEDEINEKFKKRELHENKHKHKEPLKSAEKKKNETIIEDNIERKIQRHEKSHGTVKQSKKEKALECIFGKKRDDIALKEFRKMGPEKPPSAKLLEKLFEKTKKLSWTLLGES